MKKFLKVISALLALCALTLVVASCKKEGDSGETTAVNANLTLDIEKLAEALSKVKFVEEVVKVKSDIVSVSYSFTSGAENVVVYAASGATPEDIIIAEYKDAAAAKAALTKYQEYCDARKKTFDTYNSQYRYELDKMILEQAGKYVIYCVSDDYSNAVKTLDSYIK